MIPDATSQLAEAIAAHLGHTPPHLGQRQPPSPQRNPVVVIAYSAAESGQPADFRIELDNTDLYVALVMFDRWQSHSIEADLLNTGDKIEGLIGDELAELGYEERTPGDSQAPCAHFRTEDKLFTFRTRLPIGSTDPDAAATASIWLKAYVAAFTQLGDIGGGGGGH